MGSSLSATQASLLTARLTPGSHVIVMFDEDDVPRRQSRRTGMLLNAEELPGLVRFPTSAVRAPKLSRLTQKSKPAPALVNQPGEYFLGWNHHLGNKRGVWLTGNKLDFGAMLDTGKIFLAKLSQGAIGRENSYLLGSLLVAKFHQLAMSRQRQAASTRKDFWLYLDEFQDFITPSMAEILAGARKYRVGLTLAHQELRQLQRDADVSSAVLSNAFTRVCFRVGDQDARALESGFSFFEARDLQNLGNGEALCQVERSDFDFNMAVPWPDYPDDTAAAARRNEVITASRNKYATPRAEVEAALFARADVTAPPVSKKPDVAPSPPAAPTPAPSRDISPVPPMPAAAAPPAPPPPPPVPAAAASPAPPPPVPVPAVAATPKPETALPDFGRGGNQHKMIQRRLKTGAEELGFRVFIEKPILDGAGSVDLVLERAGISIACEITVTTPIDKEVRHVANCLKAGFSQIVMLAVTEDRLAKLAAAVAAAFGAETAARVGYFLPDAFLAWLQALPPPAPPVPPAAPAPVTTTVRGWKVRANYPQLTPEETKAREDAAIKLLAESMKKPRGMPPNSS